MAFVSILASMPPTFSIRLHAEILRRFGRTILATALIGLAWTWPWSALSAIAPSALRFASDGGAPVASSSPRRLPATRPDRQRQGRASAAVAWSGGL